MKKHIDIWDEHLRVILSKQHSMIANWTEGQPFPNTIYRLTNDLRAERWIVDQIKYDVPQFRVSFRGKVPTAMDLIRIQEASKFDPVYDEANIVITAIRPGRNEKTAVRLQSFKDKAWFFSQFEAETRALEIKKKKEDEVAKVNAGTHVYCDRCGKLVEREAAWKMKVAGTSNSGNIYSIDMTFCSLVCGETEQINALR